MYREAQEQLHVFIMFHLDKVSLFLFFQHFFLVPRCLTDFSKEKRSVTLGVAFYHLPPSLPVSQPGGLSSSMLAIGFWHRGPTWHRPWWPKSSGDDCGPPCKALCLPTIGVWAQLLRLDRAHLPPTLLAPWCSSGHCL